MGTSIYIPETRRKPHSLTKNWSPPLDKRKSQNGVPKASWFNLWQGGSIGGAKASVVKASSWNEQMCFSHLDVVFLSPSELQQDNLDLCLCPWCHFGTLHPSAPLPYGPLLPSLKDPAQWFLFQEGFLVLLLPASPCIVFPAAQSYNYGLPFQSLPSHFSENREPVLFLFNLQHHSAWHTVSAHSVFFQQICKSSLFILTTHIFHHTVVGYLPPGYSFIFHVD